MRSEGMQKNVLLRTENIHSLESYNTAMKCWIHLKSIGLEFEQKLFQNAIAINNFLTLT